MIKRLLAKARNIDAEVRTLEKAKQDALGNAIYQAQSYSEAVQGSKKNSKENQAIAYTSYTEKLDERITFLFDAKRAAVQAISLIEDTTDRAVMTDFYINGKTLEQIAEDEGYSVSGVKYKLKKSLEELEKHYP